MDDKQLKDEQELAKVLAGLNQPEQAKDNFNSAKPLASLPNIPAKPAETKTMPAASTPVSQPQPVVAPTQATATTATTMPFNPDSTPVSGTTPVPQPVQPVTANAPVAPFKPVTPPTTDPTKNNNLTSLLHNAISDLRPLVDKLDLPNEEKFDAYLLLIRSTDDSSLVQPAYEVAKKITSENIRAKALLNIIKEINYFNSKR